MKLRYKLLVATLFMAGVLQLSAQTMQPFSLRAPAYPLVTIDPYTSAWSCSDKLYDDVVRHWTGATHGLIGAIRVDGKVFRFLGKEELAPVAVLPGASRTPWSCQYTVEQPAEGWEKAAFDDSKWSTGKGAFGTWGQPNMETLWEQKSIWVRREFNLTANDLKKELTLIYSHDDDFTLYLNGEKIVDTGYKWLNNVELKLTGDLSKLLKEGKNIIAAHCENRTGGGLVDFGIYSPNTNPVAFGQAAVQTNVNVLPTQTIYDFTCGGVNLQVTFTSPLLPSDLDLISRPVNYIDYTVKANDGQKHDVQIYIEATAQWAVNTQAQPVEYQKFDKGNLTFLKAGTKEQKILGRKGDDVRIDWGHLFLVGTSSEKSSFSIDDFSKSKVQFGSKGVLTNKINRLNENMTLQMGAIAYAENLGSVSAEAKNGFVMIGYDDIQSIQYFNTNLPAWWSHNGMITIEEVFALANLQHADLLAKCNKFNQELLATAFEAGGQKYAELCALAYRQSIAAHKLLNDKEGNILFLSKENFSNGSIGTVDITYPSAPLFLYYNPNLLKGMLNPIFYYSESGKWNKPFPAHDVGTYPLANGQTYGEDMPIEEAGNMLVLTAAIGKAEGNFDYARKHWDVLTRWANYLAEKGLDPENQLCTDDFAGHLAHNANLSVKAIMGIASFSLIAEKLGHDDLAAKYHETAKTMAAQWEQMAKDGDHYSLSFDKKETWSQKYNLVWDEILGTNIFPKTIAETEINYYLKMQNPYGLPLDSRRTYTKSDWIIWTATLANKQTDFEKFIEPVYNAFNTTSRRVPMTDWYETTNADYVGFQARSVVGGYFIKMLKEKK